MLGKFWEAAGTKLAERWAASATPALIFWLGGLLAWSFNHGGPQHLAIVNAWLNRQSNVALFVTVLATLSSIAASAVAVDRLVAPGLRLLEGYWPAPLSWLRSRLCERAMHRAEAEEAAWQQLAPRVLEQPATATREQLATFVRLDQRRRRRPARPNLYMPTRIGNILRSAETWPADKYGLDSTATWPRLWLVLPETTRKELLAARAKLDSAVAAAVWGVLFCGFTAWTWLALPIGLAVAGTAIILWVPPRAETFADLVESAYDLHRTVLYQQLRWPLPTDPRNEHHEGARLTAYLWRGSDDADPTFAAPE